MKNKVGFDHLIGGEESLLAEEDLKVYERIIKAHSAEQSPEQKRLVQQIKLRFEMMEYLKSDPEELRTTGSFLEILLSIYRVKKSDFAEFIELEPTNFYALLKGRRKFNHVIAKKVGQIFGIDPELWLFIEAKNEMKRYHRSEGNKDKKYTLENLLKKSQAF